MAQKPQTDVQKFRKELSKKTATAENLKTLAEAVYSQLPKTVAEAMHRNLNAYSQNEVKIDQLNLGQAQIVAKLIELLGDLR